jgi:hypothetical protein
MKFRFDRAAAIELSTALDSLQADDEDPDHFIMVEVSDDTARACLTAVRTPWAETIAAAKNIMHAGTPFSRYLSQRVIDQATDTLDVMTAEQRLEIFKLFCARCGMEKPHTCDDIDIE